MKKILSTSILAAVLLTMCLSFVACGGVTYTMSVDALAIEVGQTSSAVKAYEEDSEGTTTMVSDLTWSSSDTSVATVNEYGQVTGVATGTVTITAKGGSGSGTVEVTVSKLTYTASAATTVEAGGTGSVSMLAGGKAVTADVTYSSSNTSVATVSSGTVTGVSAGTATITMTRYGNTVTCEVTVEEAVAISASSVMLIADETETLTLTEGDTDVTSSATWTSSDTSVATVSGGVVTGVSTGTATITASYDGKSRTCEVTGADSKSTATQTSIATSGTYVADVFYKSGGSTWDGTSSVTDGVVTLDCTSADSVTSTSSASMLRYMPLSSSGSGISNKEDITVYYTLFNNTNASIQELMAMSGETSTSWNSVAAGETVVRSYTYTSSSSKQLNIKHYGYGVGTLVYSDFYFIYN